MALQARDAVANLFDRGLHMNTVGHLAWKPHLDEDTYDEQNREPEVYNQVQDRFVRLGSPRRAATRRDRGTIGPTTIESEQRAALRALSLYEGRVA